MKLQAKAKDLLTAWRGEGYSFGPGAVESVAGHAGELGRGALLIANQSRWLRPVLGDLQQALPGHGVVLAAAEVIPGAAANAPREDVLRLAAAVAAAQPEVVIAVGGGSTIDAAKAAVALAALGDVSEPQLERIFGTGAVTAALRAADGSLPALVAVQTAASSAAHLTKYSNVTDIAAGQKKLIVDDALVPERAVFDYAMTLTTPTGLTIDGAFDGIAHCLEVLWGAPPAALELITEIAACGVELIVKYLPAAVEDRDDLDARIALGLGTDLGGYSIMVGGTNGPHLNSFSLVDVASHGRACAVLNPYWVVFFAPAIEERLRLIGEIYARHGYITEDLEALAGRQLGEAVARGMRALSDALGYPTTLGELSGFDEKYVAQALAAAKDPQLAMKLQNMPLPLSAATVDRYMGSVLAAATAGDLALIRDYEG